MTIINFWVKNDRLPVSYVYDHTTRKKVESEVKSGWAKLVLGWLTAWENFVLWTFHFPMLLKICLQKTEYYRFLGKK